MIANPIAVSLAAKTKIIKLYTCPIKSSKSIENTKKLKLAANIINSNEINIIIIWFRDKYTPKKPKKNNKDDTVRYSIIFFSLFTLLPLCKLYTYKIQFYVLKENILLYEKNRKMLKVVY